MPFSESYSKTRFCSCKANYAERYEESQHNVMKLKNRLEELHSYAKDKESVLEQVQSNERRQAVALQELCKVGKCVVDGAWPSSVWHSMCAK